MSTVNMMRLTDYSDQTDTVTPEPHTIPAISPSSFQRGDFTILIRSSPVQVVSSQKQLQSEYDDSDVQEFQSIKQTDSDFDEDGTSADFTTSILDNIKKATQTKNSLEIRVPVLSEIKSAKCNHLPGHFSVTKVLFALQNREYIVKLASDEIDQASLQIFITQLAEIT